MPNLELEHSTDPLELNTFYKMNAYRRIKSDSLSLFMNGLNLDNWEAGDLNEVFGLSDNSGKKKKGILMPELENITVENLIMNKSNDVGESNKDLDNRLDTATDDENVIFKPLTHGGDDESSPWLRRKRQISPSREIPTSKLRRLQDRDTDFQRKKVLLTGGGGSTIKKGSGMSRKNSTPTGGRKIAKSRRRLNSMTGQILITSIFSPRSKTPEDGIEQHHSMSGQGLPDPGDASLNE